MSESFVLLLSQNSVPRILYFYTLSDARLHTPGDELGSLPTEYYPTFLPLSTPGPLPPSSGLFSHLAGTPDTAPSEFEDVTLRVYVIAVLRAAWMEAEDDQEE